MRILKTELKNKGAHKIRLRSIFLNACAMQHAFGFLGGKGNFLKNIKSAYDTKENDKYGKYFDFTFATEKVRRCFFYGA